jgi:hypothetical protein
MKNNPGFKIFLFLLGALIFLVQPLPALAVEVAPRISDREIVEKLSKLEEGQKSLEKRMDGIDKRFDDLRSEMNGKFGDLRSDMNGRFDTLQWMFGVFITVALAIFAAIGRILWDQNRSRAVHEKIILNLSGEIESLKQTDLKLMDQIKALIEALKPPRGVL